MGIEPPDVVVLVREPGVTMLDAVGAASVHEVPIRANGGLLTILEGGVDAAMWPWRKLRSLVWKLIL